MENNNTDLSLRAQRALYEVRALRALASTEVAIIAERKVIKKLSPAETLAVAIELWKDEEDEADNA